MLIDLFKNKIKSLALIFPVVLISLITIGSCLGPNPPEAPFNSTLSFLGEFVGIENCGGGLEPELFEVSVVDDQNIPLNGVKVYFDLSFANQNSLIIDTDGNGIPDAPLLQMVNNDACPGGCLNTDIELFFEMGAFVPSRFETETDRYGVAEVLIIFPGYRSIYDTTRQFLSAESVTLSVSSGSNFTSNNFGVNAGCDEE